MIHFFFFGIFDDMSLWILPETYHPSLCDAPNVYYDKINFKSLKLFELLFIGEIESISGTGNNL